MSFTIRILQPSDKEAVMAFAGQQLAARVTDPMERELQSWSARWRQEALEHYLPQGWSFAAFQGEQLCGFFLAQPFLFYRGLTQTLWIEHCEFSEPDVARQLIDTAHRWARDKHFQCVLVDQTAELAALLEGAVSSRSIDLPLLEMKSARY